MLIERGYRFHGNRAYAIQLTKPHPTKKFKMTGAPYRDPLGGISRRTLTNILMFSQDAVEAADQIEAMCAKGQLEPEFKSAHAPGAGAKVDQELLERMAQNRADGMVAKREAEREIRESEREIEMKEVKLQLTEAQAAIKQLTKKKPAAKGKAKPRKSAVAAAKAKLSSEPALTEQQEKMAQEVMAGFKK